MARHHISADWIYEQTMKQIAPLPCQKEYLRQLSSLMSFHKHRNELLDRGLSVDDLPAPSAVVVAPTGQGKTFLLRKMAEAARINCIIVDGSTLAAEGWRGAALGQRLLHAKEQARNDRTFERSILFIDEIDKIRFWGTNHDQGNPTNNLLSLYNSGYYVTEDAGKNTVNIDIRRFTVILGGAFTGIEDIIRERISPKARVGFVESENRQKYTDADFMQMVTLDDLKKFGMSQEFLGRIGSILTLLPMGIDDYKQLLSADTGSAQAKYNNYLQKLYGVSFEVSEAGSMIIAEQCMKLKTGARAVNPMINVMRNTISEVERNQKIRKVILDADERGHIVRYEYGDRDHGLYAHKHSNASSLEVGKNMVCKIHAKSFSALVNKLCRYYKNAGGAAYREPELRSFLNCALMYIFEHLRNEEHSFESLFKLVDTVERKYNEPSVFEKLMQCRLGQHKFFEEYKALYHPDLQRHLTDSLWVVKNYMVEQNGDVEFMFMLKHGALRSV